MCVSLDASLPSGPEPAANHKQRMQMFSILNEIKDNSPGSVVTVIGSSIGSAASVYILVAITGYLTFGSDVKGNIVGMCTWGLASSPLMRCVSLPQLTRPVRSPFHRLDNRQGSHRRARHLQHPPADSPLPRLDRRRPPLATG